MTGKRKATRRTVTLMVTVSVPVDMKVAQVTKEVRSLINDQCNYSAEPEDIRVNKCGAMRRTGL